MESPRVSTLTSPSPFPFLLSPARDGVRGVQPGMEAEVSGAVLVPCSLAVPVRSQLQLVLFMPISPLHPAASSAVPVCVHLPPSNPRHDPDKNKMFFFWASFHLSPSSSTHSVSRARGAACRGKRRVARPKVCSGTPEGKHGL